MRRESVPRLTEAWLITHSPFSGMGLATEPDHRASTASSEGVLVFPAMGREEKVS